MNDQINENHTEIDEFDSLEFTRFIVESIWDSKGKNAIAIDLRGRVSYTDFVIICTGTSPRHVQAISRKVEEDVKNHYGIVPMGREGLDAAHWALIDFGDAILHTFDNDVREDYNLEKMWADAPRLTFENRPADLYGHFELDRFPEENQ